MPVIAFEGIDGSGKTTLLASVKEVLEKEYGKEVLAHAFPSRDVGVGQMALDAINGKFRCEAQTLQLLLEADRYLFVPVIFQALKESKWVLLDRYRLSGVAYGVARGLPRWYCETLQEYLPAPDMTIFVRVSPEEVIRRREHVESRVDRDLALQLKVARIYEELLNSKAVGRWTEELDGFEPVDKLTNDVISAFERLGYL